LWRDSKIVWYENLSPRVSGDANRDGRVDDDDLSLLLANWGQETDWAHGELSGQTPVNDHDLSLLLAYWTGAGDGAVSAASEAFLPAVQMMDERPPDTDVVVSTVDGSTDPRSVTVANNLGLVADLPAESLSPLARYFDVQTATGRARYSSERSGLDEQPVTLLVARMALGT
jgi:hypothetical protein